MEEISTQGSNPLEKSDWDSFPADSEHTSERPSDAEILDVLNRSYLSERDLCDAIRALFVRDA